MRSIITFIAISLLIGSALVELLADFTHWVSCKMAAGSDRLAKHLDSYNKAAGKGRLS